MTVQALLIETDKAIAAAKRSSDGTHLEHSFPDSLTASISPTLLPLLRGVVYISSKPCTCQPPSFTPFHQSITNTIYITSTNINIILRYTPHFRSIFTPLQPLSVSHALPRHHHGGQHHHCYRHSGSHAARRDIRGVSLVPLQRTESTGASTRTWRSWPNDGGRDGAGAEPAKRPGCDYGKYTGRITERASELRLPERK